MEVLRCGLGRRIRTLMKPTSVLTAALACSLLVNLVLWARIEREARASALAAGEAHSSLNRTASAGAGVNVSRERSANPAGGADSVKRGVVWRAAGTPEELRKLAEDLRAAGFPPDAIRSLIYQSVRGSRTTTEALAKLPFWHQGYQSKAGRELREQWFRDVTAIEETVLGKRQPHEIDPLQRAARYGNLPDDKVAALAKVEQDYGEIYWQQRRGADGVDALETFEGRARIRLLEEEKERDLAAMLTPEEFEDYERRGSRAAQPVIAGVSEIEVTPEEYMALYQLQRSYLASIPRTESPEEMAAYLHGMVAPPEQVRTVLKDDRFYSYMEKTDPVYAQVARFAKTTPSLTRDQTYQLYQLQSAALLAVARTAAPGQQSDLANLPAGRAAAAPFSAQLDTLLGPAAAAAYRRSTMGRMFGPPSGP